MLKKILSAILALALVLSFAACNGEKDVRGKVSKKNAATESVEEETKSQKKPQKENEPEVEETEPAVEETEPEIESATEPVIESATEPVEENAFSVGTNIAGTYTSEFIGITCTLDNNWNFLTDEEIRALNESYMDRINFDYEELLENATIIYELMATNVNGTDTVVVLLEKLTGGNVRITEEQYIELTKNGLISNLTTMGLTIDSAEATTVRFAGKQCAALVVSGSYMSIPVYEYLVVLKCDNYIACITVCTWFENTCEDVLNLFAPY